MDLPEFERSLTGPAPPRGLSPALEALWYARRGDWHRAHDIAQDETDRESAWVHAYLHRCEGDQWNAEYWYRQAAQPLVRGDDLDQEWRKMVTALLGTP